MPAVATQQHAYWYVIMTPVLSRQQSRRNSTRTDWYVITTPVLSCQQSRRNSTRTGTLLRRQCCHASSRDATARVLTGTLLRRQCCHASSRDATARVLVRYYDANSFVSSYTISLTDVLFLLSTIGVSGGYQKPSMRVDHTRLFPVFSFYPNGYDTKMCF